MLAAAEERTEWMPESGVSGCCATATSAVRKEAMKEATWSVVRASSSSSSKRAKVWASFSLLLPAARSVNPAASITASHESPPLANAFHSFVTCRVTNFWSSVDMDFPLGTSCLTAALNAFLVTRGEERPSGAMTLLMRSADTRARPDTSTTRRTLEMSWASSLMGDADSSRWKTKTPSSSGSWALVSVSGAAAAGMSSSSSSSSAASPDV
mmetsp:Transcript_12231/g.16609  ORF Transcript_12231/g.16609 Transcript_12231/m.16609 type:complete len:211 (+) Transcript_12231:209-841(+)